MPGTAPAISITKRRFLEETKKGQVPPVYAEIDFAPPADLYPTFGGPGSVLFESSRGPVRPEKTARYSIIGFDPYLTLRLKNGVLDLTSVTGKSSVTARGLRHLKGILRGYSQKPDANLPPFQGGAVGLLSYDYVHYIEKLPRTAKDDLSLPDAHFLLVDSSLVFDHVERKAWVVVSPGARLMKEHAMVDWARAFDEAEHRLYGITERIERARGKRETTAGKPSRGEALFVHRTGKSEYMEMVARAKEYIAAGDIYQANLSLRLEAPLSGLSPWEAYRMLREINPSPFGGFMDMGDYFIASSSPERLVRLRGGAVDTRPIAGTRPRGRDDSEDSAMRDELLLNEKERAEHIMLIDLERNDIGRVCSYGSVEADELMITEDCSHVMHIVSNVRGEIVPGRDAFDLIRAVFPGGTITGVPKVRCMEVIDELEPVARGPYTGSMGYIGFSGDMDLNIIIRTFVIKDGTAYVQAGAGIVADSDPEREYFEVMKKAEALVRTLGRLQ